ncbi:hypothetical protein EMIT013CA1_90029 [Bacillus sp. IT-13CA1]
MGVINCKGYFIYKVYTKTVSIDTNLHKFLDAISQFSFDKFRQRKKETMEN